MRRRKYPGRVLRVKCHCPYAAAWQLHVLCVDPFPAAAGIGRNKHAAVRLKRARNEQFVSITGIDQNAGKIGRFLMKNVPFVVNNSLNPWYKQREMPEPPKESFGDWYLENRKK